MIRKNHKTIKWSLLGFTLFFTLSLIALFIFGGVLDAGKHKAYAAEPYTPTNKSEILETLKLSNIKNSAILNKIREQFKAAPESIKLASQLAKLYIEIARENTDVRYYGYAEAVLARWWYQEKPPTDVFLLRATLNQQKHDYAKAIGDLKLLIKQQPNHVQAWLTLSIIQQVRGDYPSTRASCSALSRAEAKSGSSWLSRLCHSQVLGLTGSAERAFKIQQSILLQLGNSQPDLLQWVLGINAETALRLGRKKQAEALFKKALAINLRDAYILRVYSDFLLDENRVTEVLSLLKDEEQDSTLLLRLAIAAKQSALQESRQTSRQKSRKSTVIEKYQRLLESRFKAAKLRGSKLHERDEALYLLEFNLLEVNGSLNKGLKLVRDNWNLQKEPDDALILLRLALKSNSEKDIQIIRDWMFKTKLEDPRILRLLKGGRDV